MFGFLKSQRLLSSSDYKNVFENTALKSGSKEFLILAASNSVDSPRLGIIVAKKHVRLAHQRNRCKRLFRESFRLHQSQLPNLDFIILARPGINQSDNEALFNRLDQQWGKLCQKAKQL